MSPLRFGQEQRDAEASLVLGAPLPTACDHCGDLTNLASLCHLLDQYSIAAGVFSAEIADLAALDVDSDCVPVVWIVEFGDEGSGDSLAVSVLGLPTADPRQGLLVVRLSDYFDSPALS